MLLLFLHGFLGSSQDFAAIASRFSPAFTPLCLDLPGHGQADPLDPEREPMMAIVAAEIVARLDRDYPGQPAAIVGYSLGGRLALYLGLRYPERFPRVVLESASPGLRTAAERAERLERDHRWAAAIVEDFEAFLDRWYEQPLFDSLRQHPQFATLRSLRQHQRPEELARVMLGLSLGNQPNLWELLAQYPQPLLLVVGERDPKFVKISEAMQQSCPQVQRLVIPGAGHNVHWEQPNQFIETIGPFLEAVLKKSMQAPKYNSLPSQENP